MLKYKYQKLYRIFAALLLPLMGMMSLAPVAADTNVQTVAQNYTASGNLQQGMIVSPADKNATAVVAATVDGTAKMLGVVVSATAAPVTLSSTSTSAQQVYVVNSGRYNVLVSNQNGAISSGDYLSVSSLDGVAMRADNSQAKVVGRAATSFDGVHNVSATTTVKTDDGKSVKVALGSIPVAISITSNPLATVGGAKVPGFLQNAAQVVTDRQVSAARLYLGALVFVLSTIVAASLLFSGVRSSMVAVGRNPLARRSITRSLIQVILTSLIIFVIGLFAVYLIVKL